MKPEFQPKEDCECSTTCKSEHKCMVAQRIRENLAKKDYQAIDQLIQDYHCTHRQVLKALEDVAQSKNSINSTGNVNIEEDKK